MGVDDRSALPTLRTERLALRPLDLAQDVEALHAIYRDRRTMRYMPTPPHRTVAETRAHFEREMSRPRARYWVISLRDDTAPIGCVNFLGATRIPGLGYVVRRDLWGGGIAVEACREALAYGFQALGHAQTELWIDEANARSLRVAAKLGFRLRGSLPLRYLHEAEQHIMLVFGLWREEWLGEAPAGRPARFFGAQPVLLVRDVAASVAFYRDKLGFSVDFEYGDGPEHAGVSRGDWSGRAASVQLSLAPPERPPAHPWGYLYFMVGSRIDELATTFEATGVELLGPPTSYPWGMREFALRDPDGHVLRFGTHG